MPDAIEKSAPAAPAAPRTSAKAPSAKENVGAVEQVGLRVSLIPSEEQNRHDPKTGFRKWLISIITAVAILAAVCAYLIVRIYQAKAQIAVLNSQSENYKQQSASLGSSISEAKATQSRLRVLSTLLGSHRSVAPIFSFLERHILSDVALSSISIAENGIVNLTVSAASYESYAGQLNELRSQPEIKDLTASGLSPVYGPKGDFQQVNFTMALTFDQSIFLIKKP
jgi:hypothetical protein